jgi:hypothetical protein
MRDYASAQISADEVVAVGHGKKIEGRAEGPWAALDGDGRLVAVYEGANPAVVLAPAGGPGS